MYDIGYMNFIGLDNEIAGFKLESDLTVPFFYGKACVLCRTFN